MQIGKLRHRVTIQSLAVTQDAFGGQTNTWSTFQASVPCSIEPLSGREYLTAAADQAQVTAKATIRYLSGVLPTMRIVTADSETYVIRAVLPDATARRSIVLMLEKGVTSD